MTVRYDEADLPQLNPFDEAFLADPVRFLTSVRRDHSVVRGLFGPLVTRHADVTRLLHDPRLRGPGTDFFAVVGITEGPIFERMRRILLFMEGEDHHRLRRLVSKAFTPQSVNALRPIARDVVSSLVDSVVAAGRCDAIPSLCEPFPIPVICALIGIPDDRWPDMSRWATHVLQAVSFEVAQHRVAIEEQLAEMDAFLSHLIEQRRVEPRADLLTALVEAHDGEDRLDHDELLAMVSMMLVAGTDTTRHQLGCLLHAFASNPDQWDLLRARPELVAAAVEEGIRYEPAVDVIPRFAVEDLEVGGVMLPAGSLVALLSASANQDETVLVDALTFDISRTPPEGWRMLTFGGGIHYCLGANLARLELQEALAVLSARLPALCLDGEPVRRPAGNAVGGWASLPIRWTGC